MTVLAVSMAALSINLMLISITLHLRRIAEALETQVRAAASIDSPGEREEDR